MEDISNRLCHVPREPDDSPSPDDNTNGNQSQTDVECHYPHPRLAVREHKVAVAASEVSGDEHKRKQDVSRKPVVLVETTGRVSVRLACLGCDETDQTLDDDPGDDRETHLPVSRNEVGSSMNVFVVDD